MPQSGGFVKGIIPDHNCLLCVSWRDSWRNIGNCSFSSTQAQCAAEASCTTDRCICPCCKRDLPDGGASVRHSVEPEIYRIEGDYDEQFPGLDHQHRPYASTR